MITIYSEKHRLRDAKTELFGGLLVPPFENPSRADIVLARVNSEKLGAVIAPKEFGMEPVLALHDAGFVEFLQVAWDEWSQTEYEGEVIPICWPARRMSKRIPDFIDGKVGYYALSSETSINKGTWEAAEASKDVALTGAELLLNRNESGATGTSGAEGVFALCRPPGHHAAYDMFGGYCFLNNAAIAAQWFRDNGIDRVAILDIDFHHGNGTQDIFYQREDVLYLSLHGDPRDAFPHFSGYLEETGQDAGTGATFNWPMPPGTQFKTWCDKLKESLTKINQFGAKVLVLSLGVDTFEKDPISFFKLKSDDFLSIGKLIAELQCPTLFVMEGGYDIKELGINTVNVLQAFEG
ncbi:MAG TPA: histone deacetylase family protein [Deltaproteobacteria bacterium]|nr:histone deacetylase family protein [SAR324 cluster bacterium]HIA57790.1 histone deacetylase family protein [Candidatus Lambdaproteobacteria bacterium]HIN48109.1 histone deacetylase family protein [Deltaproteobacteria bacterium]